MVTAWQVRGSMETKLHNLLYILRKISKTMYNGLLFERVKKIWLLHLQIPSGGLKHLSKQFQSVCDFTSTMFYILKHNSRMSKKKVYYGDTQSPQNYLWMTPRSYLEYFEGSVEAIITTDHIFREFFPNKKKDIY